MAEREGAAEINCLVWTEYRSGSSELQEYQLFRAWTHKRGLRQRQDATCQWR
jgi:hypothetical protein